MPRQNYNSGVCEIRKVDPLIKGLFRNAVLNNDRNGVKPIYDITDSRNTIFLIDELFP